ncbi:MAG: hypothetical protein JRN61_01580 [Nitrososphaerota archaeon]|nr:hypothetical protein [Nitrososphaerota archaeon]MDG7047651.1 hypothetical protein [Nitrososphaerota archaeon]
MIKSQEIGSLKKPAWLLASLKSENVEEKEKAKDDASYINLRRLEDIGLDYVYDGEARRIEMYEQPIREIGGFIFADRIRSWDNKYYRKARCVDEVKYLRNYHKDEFAFVKANTKRIPKVPVTGPYTFMDWSYDEHYRDRSLFLLALSKVVNSVLSDLEAMGAPVLQVDEPAATAHPDEMDLFVEGFNAAVRGINSKVTVHICYSGDEYTSLMPRLQSIHASHFALEFANRDSTELGVSSEIRRGYRALEMFREYGSGKELGLGVIDVHTDFIEPPELIRDRILYSVKVLKGASKIVVNPDCGLRTRSRDIAFSKLSNMIKGIKLAEEEVL